ncbi:hypothetical protein HYPSUDRAFT_148731 [Hypholoma sublateritium FD-334 SS-4]|uniref:Uncharacterized protein n=1 Tax=Hypholoma sublateritium (strain FD-334 SS-4) TaxID=945553 RepID=A0A0D2LXW2_HYPSF|nr:hypothetical protein HYPSUDRAFT_148731 [Hypholoma sublateritium FD-334 SS-4]
MRAGEVLNASTEEEIVLESGDEYSDSGDEDNFAVNEEADATIEEVEEDEGQTAHNDQVAKSVQERAVQYMQSHHVYLDADEVEEALQIFPRVAGLARRVHDSSTLKEKFDKLVSETESLEGNRTALVRRVPTRWNSDLDCLLAHFYFKEVIEQLTAIPSLGLKHYSLSDSQWKLAEDVREILLVRANILLSGHN